MTFRMFEVMKIAEIINVPRISLVDISVGQGSGD